MAAKRAGEQKNTSGSSPLQNGAGHTAFLRLKVVPNIQNQTVQEIIAANFEKNTVVECDSYKSYLNLNNVEVRAKKYTTGDLHWLHTALSNLKNLIRGTYHGRCTELQP